MKSLRGAVDEITAKSVQMCKNLVQYQVQSVPNMETLHIQAEQYKYR